jgi:WD40 repeat protein
MGYENSEEFNHNSHSIRSNFIYNGKKLLKGGVCGLSVSERGSYVASCSIGDNTAKVWDLRTYNPAIPMQPVGVIKDPENSM